jgi:cysteine synthase/O-phosphoserine sulfhydrylase/cystathionine beta-synthase
LRLRVVTGSNNVAIVDLASLRRVFEADLALVMKAYGHILRSRRLDKPLIVEKDTRVVVGGVEFLEALDLLSASKAPALLVGQDQIMIRRPSGEILKVGDLLEELWPRRGRLSFRDFEIKYLLDIPSIDVSLDHLCGDVKLDKRMLRVYDDTLSLLVENWPTPLVRLKSFSSDYRGVYAKLESFNPFSNSVKDRIGWAMIMDALSRGALGDLLYEATSTNTGIALVSIVNALGRKIKLFIPKTIQRASDVFLRALGAEVARVPVSLTVEAIAEVEASARRDGATHLNQFENDANFKVHLKYTAREIDQQLESIGIKPDYVIGGLGTSGHMSAISFYFKSKYGDSVKVVGVQPAQGHVIPGIRRVESGMKWIHMVEFDEIIDVTLDEAVEGAIEVARKEGLLIGLSSGAVFKAFRKLSPERGNIVLIFPDSGYKYAEQFEEYFKKCEQVK